MKWRRALMFGFLTLPGVLALALGFGRDPRAVPFVLQGKPAPSWVLERIDGGQVDLQSLRGRPVVLNFWASWCYPCMAEHEVLQNSAQALVGRAHFVGIVYEDTAEAARQVLAQKGSHYPQVLDHDSRVAIDYGVAGVPESFILDAQGTIVHKEAGVLSERTLAKYLLPLLSRQDGAPSSKEGR